MSAARSTETLLSTLAVSSIRASATNPRQSFDAASMADLKASIAASGIQVPLLVRPLSGDGMPEMYELVAGERRLRAAIELGIFDVPCLVREMDDAEARECQIVENLQRAGVHPLEEALAYREMIKAAEGWTVPAGRFFVEVSEISPDGRVVYVCHPRAMKKRWAERRKASAKPVAKKAAKV